MIKTKNLMIAAAALLSFTAPSIAYAGKVGQAFKDLRQQKQDIRDQKHQNKLDYLNGDITKDQFKTNKQDYIDQVGDVQDTLDEYKATR